MPTAQERIAALRERGAKPDNAPRVEPTIKTDQKSDFTVTHWFDRICAAPNMDNIRAAADYYTTAVADGKFHIVPVGNLETLLLELPGVTFYYHGIYVDVQQVRRWLEERLSRMEAAKHNYYMHDEAAKAEFGVLKTTEAAKMAKADAEVMDLGSAIRLMAYHEHQLETLMSAFDNNKYMLNNVVTIRKEKLEDVWIDPTRGTTNA